MSSNKQSAPSGTGRRGKGRSSAERRTAVDLEPLQGEDRESLSRKCAVTAATLSDWRDASFVSGEASLKIREDDLLDEQGRRTKSVVAELAMTVELKCERIPQLENANPSQVALHRPQARARVVPVWGAAARGLDMRRARS